MYKEFNQLDKGSIPDKSVVLPQDPKNLPGHKIERLYNQVL